MKELSYPTSMPIPTLSVVIPCYNEQGQIENLLTEWSAHLGESAISHEFIVINDGSLDGTSRVLDRLRKELKHLRIVHQLNSGHGKAVQRGYELSRGEWVLQLDSSRRFEPSDFDLFWKERDEKDLIIAQRTHRLDSFVRRLSLSLLRAAIDLLFKIEVLDPDVSFRLFRRAPVLEKLRHLPRAIRGINLSMTVLMKMTAPHRVLDVKVPYRARPLHKGRLSLLQSLSVLRNELSELLRLKVLLKGL